jgi:hypothetical protein
VSDPSQEPQTDNACQEAATTPRDSPDFEQSLAALSDERSALSPTDDCEKWAKLSVRLGDMYSTRQLGECSENRRVAIQCYNDALAVYKAQHHPLGWIVCHHNVGREYLKTFEGPDRILKKISLLHYQMALALISKETWPEMWHAIELELALLFRRHSQSPDDEDARLSTEHYQLAFDLNRDQRPDLYDWMKTTFDLYLRYFELQFELRSVQENEAEAQSQRP